MNRTLVIRVGTAVVCLTGLVLVFVFQKVNVGSFFGEQPSIYQFIINRSIRFLLNDVFAIGLIYAIFAEKKYVVFSLWVQVAGLVLFLIPYFILKLNFPDYNGPMINYLHRLILNPTLLLLLIPAFYYQRRVSKL